MKNKEDQRLFRRLNFSRRRNFVSVQVEQKMLVNEIFVEMKSKSHCVILNIFSLNIACKKKVNTSKDKTLQVKILLVKV